MCEIVEALHDLLARRPAIVAEVVGRQAVSEHCATVLRGGVDCLVISIGALADPALFARLKSAAKDGHARLILPAGAIYRAVAAVEQSSGLTRLFLVNDVGEVFTSAEVYLKGGGKAWQAPQPFGGVDLPALRDIDAAWVDGSKRIQIFAVDESGRLWTREAKTPSVSAGWNDWQQLESYLDASQNGLRPPPEDIATLTAGHWSEDFSGGGKKSVLFATDSYGNIYYSSEELRCTEPESCKLVRLWRSFYHF